MAKPKRKDVLTAALKGLIAATETSALGKGASTFIAELASMSEDQEQALEALPDDKFNELLTQSELATQNAASAAAGTEQIKEKIDDLAAKFAEFIPPGINKDRQPFNNIPYSSIGSLFKGRDDKLNTLIAQLDDKSKATAITQQQKDKPGAIYGLGGIGKPAWQSSLATMPLTNWVITPFCLSIAARSFTTKSRPATLSSNNKRCPQLNDSMPKWPSSPSPICSILRGPMRCCRNRPIMQS
jgi:hypothetical protein